jgi:phosphate acyltransferase
MGGDQGPGVVVEGAVLAAKENADLRLSLVGPESVLERELARFGVNGGRFEVVHAPETVLMDEAPAQAVKRKPQSSIVVATRLQREGNADGVVSAGNTGAAVAASLLELGRLPGVSRPAIAVIIPNVYGGCMLLDAGATADCKPFHLLQFAVMGRDYARVAFGRAEPRVGLLNIGEESSKGNDLSKEAHRLLAGSSLNFVGNVEGHGIFAGVADVVVCDGFVGNIVLKYSESVVGWVGGVLREELRRSLRARLGFRILKPAWEKFRTRMDHADQGGAPLLGVNGICVIAHGSSSARAIKNAVALGSRLAESEANRRIQEDLAALGGEMVCAEGMGTS